MDNDHFNPKIDSDVNVDLSIHREGVYVAEITTQNNEVVRRKLILQH